LLDDARRAVPRCAAAGAPVPEIRDSRVTPVTQRATLNGMLSVLPLAAIARLALLADVPSPGRKYTTIERLDACRTAP
jgi:hypothetical protein